MCKKLICLLFLLGCFTTTIQAQNFEDLDKSPMDAVMARNDNNSPFVRVIYSRPKKRGRTIFGELVPFGEVWRTGANEATEITFYNHASIYNQIIKPGTYTLFTIPNKDKWVFVINKKSQLWGTENYDEAYNVLSVLVEAKKTATSIEDFSISLRPLRGGTNLLLGWDDTYIEVPILRQEVPDAIEENSSEEDQLNEKKHENPKKRKRFLGIF